MPIPANWSYNDDVDIEIDEDKPQSQGGDKGGKEGGDGRVGVTHVQ